MADKISGGCACRAIRYETEAEPIVMLNCHCRDCQRAAGGAYGAFMVVPMAAVRLQGEPRYYKTVGDAGRAVERGFCASCGSPLTVKLERMPDVLGLVAASLDDPSRYKPAMDIFTDSAWPWDTLHPDTQKLPQGLP
ncbi:MAG TPA: GFA family protein [Pseudolabrys sp.]|nr:GFA family protein [Pseudolabrys sp.]